MDTKARQKLVQKRREAAKKARYANTRTELKKQSRLMEIYSEFLRRDKSPIV